MLINIWNTNMDQRTHQEFYHSVSIPAVKRRVVASVQNVNKTWITPISGLYRPAAANQQQQYNGREQGNSAG